MTHVHKQFSDWSKKVIFTLFSFFLVRMRVTILDFTCQSWNWKAYASGSLNHIFKRRKNEEVRREHDGEGVGGKLFVYPGIKEFFTNEKFGDFSFSFFFFYRNQTQAVS